MLSIRSGSAAAGKERLLAICREYGKVLVIVPEQYTLQTERDLIHGLHAPGFFDIEVLSPSRLTERVFAAAGQDALIRIDDRGKQMALARVLMENKKSLRYFESAAQKQGFIARVGTLIASFKQAGITAEQLTEHAKSLEEGAKKDKLADLALIYTAYNTLLQGQFVDGEDVINAMLSRLPASGVARGRAVCIWGFDIFIGQMNRMICALAKESLHAEALMQLGSESAFAPVWESALRLKKEAEEAGIACTITPLPMCCAAAAPALNHLREQYLCSPSAVFSAVQENIRLYAAPTPYFEAHFIAGEMLHLHEKGTAFEDMAVVWGDDRFAGTVQEVLSSYNIPCYVGRKLPAARHGAARFLIASLRAMAEGYPETEMLNMIKSGYAPLTDRQCWQLENYLLSYGIRGKKWLVPFDRGTEEEKAAAEEARLLLIAPLENLRQTIRADKHSPAVLTALYRYLEQTNVYGTLLYHQEQLLARGMAAEAVQCRQVWQALLRLMEQAYALLGDGEVTAARLSILITAGLEMCELSSLPPSAQCVMCGRIGSLPLGRPKALFAIHMTDALNSAAPSPVLSCEEQQALEKALNAYLSLSDEGQDALKELDIWKALSSPSEKLYISYALATQDGTAIRPFTGLRLIRRMFPSLVEEGGMLQKNPVAHPLAPGPALNAIGLQLRQGTLQGEWLEAWKYLCTSPKTVSSARALQQAFAPENEAAPLPREVTHRLFMERIMSVSRLENFAVCPYKHFVENGLQPQPRKEWTLTPIDAGNFYHSALEGFARLLPQLPGWPNVDKKTCDALIDEAATPLFDQLLSGVMGDSARMRALGEKYRRVLRRTAWTFTKGARLSAFTPTHAEVRFGYEGGLPPIQLTLKDGRQVFVRGIIDRIDRYAGDEGVYLRVVDYNSGENKIQPARVFWGAQLQLLLYLKAALAADENAQPAGAFYMHVADPLLADEKEQAEIEDALARMLMLRGVALKDVAILEKMDSGTPPLTMPRTVLKDGSFLKGSPLASLPDLHALISHAAECAGQLAEKMHSGHIQASPLCDSNGNGPCDRCDYAAVCRKDIRRGNSAVRSMDNLSFDELLEKINHQ